MEGAIEYILNKLEYLLQEQYGEDWKISEFKWELDKVREQFESFQKNDFGERIVGEVR